MKLEKPNLGQGWEGSECSLLVLTTDVVWAVGLIEAPPIQFQFHRQANKVSDPTSPPVSYKNEAEQICRFSYGQGLEPRGC